MAKPAESLYRLLGSLDRRKELMEKLAPGGREISRLLGSLERHQQRIVRQNVSDVRHRAAALARLFGKKRKYREVDDMFFRFEDLPMFGKEYWFMHFVSAEDDRQLILTLGRSQGDVEVNRRRLRSSDEESATKKCMAIGWFFDGKKKVFADQIQETTVFAGKKNAIVSKGKSRIEFGGTYPGYSVSIARGKKRTFSARLRKPAKRRPFEISQFFKGVFGFQLINLYFDFDGVLDGRRFRGTCYVQKIIGVGPFVPWNWVRINFGDGSALEFFTTFLSARGMRAKLDSTLLFYDSAGRLHARKAAFSIEKIGSKNPRWTVKTDDGSVFLEAASYAEHRFSFEGAGKFTYVEYFVEVNDFLLELDGCRSSLLKAGRGTGIVEDAYGFLL